MKGLFVCLVFAPGLAIGGPAWADAGAGAAAYRACAACHGPDGGGKASLNAPRIAGRAPRYLKRPLP